MTRINLRAFGDLVLKKLIRGMRKDYFFGGMMSKAGYEFNPAVGGVALLFTA